MSKEGAAGRTIKVWNNGQVRSQTEPEMGLEAHLARHHAHQQCYRNKE